MNSFLIKKEDIGFAIFMILIVSSLIITGLLVGKTSCKSNDVTYTYDLHNLPCTCNEGSYVISNNSHRYCQDINSNEIYCIIELTEVEQ